MLLNGCLSLFRGESNSGVERTGPFEYQAGEDGARFTYSFWFRRPRFMAVMLQTLEGPLDPKIYVDRGNGIDEADPITPPHDGASIYARNHLATAALAACLSGFNPAGRIEATNGTQKLRFR